MKLTWLLFLGTAATACGPRANAPPAAPAEAPAAPKQPQVNPPAEPSESPVTGVAAPRQGHGTLEALTETLRQRLIAGKPDGLADLAHPTRGVRFSPYAHVEDNDVVLSPAELRSGEAMATTRSWGAYDGTGDPIRLSFADYFPRFVLVPNPADARVGIDEVLGSGNSLNNLPEAYPGARFIEFHHPGGDPKYGGMDWQSVRFVFEAEDDRFWLIGVIHDQWTI